MHSISRRTFVKGLAAGGAAAAFGDIASAQPAPRRQQETLRGTSFDLSIGETVMNFTGSPKTALAINGSIPGPLLRWRQGDLVTLRVRNQLDEDTSIHWHGIILPANMDGVPGLSFHGIRPGDTYTYRFQVKQSGTY
ncbi:MAG: multicopper oxidase domain-containing protein, partial [Vicinamibacterales bacterium]